MLDDTAPRKPEANGLIATPPNYYSTAKAKYLGSRYKDNLDRLVERITRNPKTASLQFANNISSVGGIGFFTHSATKSPDERYLEVVLATPDTFEVKGEHSEKVQRLFSRYGLELLAIVSGDNDIYQDREMSGYGLNLAWRNVVIGPAGNRVMLERAIIYVSKERARKFTRQELNQDDLLADAVIFTVEEDGPLKLVSYRPQESQPDVRPVILEDNLAALPAVPNSTDRFSGPVKSARPVVPEQAPKSSKAEIRAPTVAPSETAESERLSRGVQPEPLRQDPVKLPVQSATPEKARNPYSTDRVSAPAKSARPTAPEPAAISPKPEIRAPIAAPLETAKSERLSSAAQPEPLPQHPVKLPVQSAMPEKAGDTLAGEQIAALKNKPIEVARAKPAVARPAPKPLAGFVIQLAFNDKEKAQRWAESMEQRGFAVSLTEAGAEGTLRVRLGNFAVRDEAERQLRTLRQDGLNGIVISLPQAFKPAARTSIP